VCIFTKIYVCSSCAITLQTLGPGAFAIEIYKDLKANFEVPTKFQNPAKLDIFWVFWTVVFNFFFIFQKVSDTKNGLENSQVLTFNREPLYNCIYINTFSRDPLSRSSTNSIYMLAFCFGSTHVVPWFVQAPTVSSSQVLDPVGGNLDGLNFGKHAQKSHDPKADEWNRDWSDAHLDLIHGWPFEVPQASWASQSRPTRSKLSRHRCVCSHSCQTAWLCNKRT
jgi:hypothetical protein